MAQKNTILRARLVQQIVEEHYEPGRQDRCLRWVWRNRVIQRYPMSERTFFRYLGIKVETQHHEQDKRQLNLFEE